MAPDRGRRAAVMDPAAEGRVPAMAAVVDRARVVVARAEALPAAETDRDRAPAPVVARVQVVEVREREAVPDPVAAQVA